MEKYLKTCEGVSREMEKEMQLVLSKKRKVQSEREDANSRDVELEENLMSPAASRTSGCSKNDEPKDVVEKCLNSPDRGAEDFEAENSASTGCVFSRETTPTSEFYGDSAEVLEKLSPKSKMINLSTPPPTIIQKKKLNPIATMPSTAELEDFFAEAEKCERKRFAEKYNYDIVKDVPLEGKYQWVRLLP